MEELQLFNDNVDARDIDSGEVSLFEFSEWLLQYDYTRLRAITIYHTPLVCSWKSSQTSSLIIHAYPLFQQQ